MIFALADVPLVYQGQEVSAQDLNNLAQNTEILDQIVHGPNPLFLAHWKLAPPAFFLTAAYDDFKTLLRKDPDVVLSGGVTITGTSYYTSIPGMSEVEEIDTWRGAFIFREGMHTLRLGFQTFPVIDDAALPVNKVAGKPAGADSASLFLIFRYTDVPIKELLANAKYQPYVRSWVYWSDVKSKYKQPYNSALDSYSFTNQTAEWRPNTVGGTLVSGMIQNGTQVVDGYAEYTTDLTQFNFIQGEIVTLKLKIALRDSTQVVANAGRRFYFSMIYANIDHDLYEVPWVDLPTITGLDQLSTLVNNQKHLVTFFKKYDNPVRASVWDQVLVGTSAFPTYNTTANFSFLGLWGFHNAADLNYFNLYAQEARYYTQKNFAIHDTISTSFLVNVNTATAFTLQGILSNTVTTAMSYRLPYAQLAQAAPTLATWNSPPGLSPLSATENQYAGTTDMASQISRQGPIHSVGSRVVRAVTYPPVLAISGISTKAVSNAVPISETMFIKKTSLFSTPSFGGFYFIRPSPLDGGVTYYSLKSGLVLGTSTKFFYGPRTGNVQAAVGTYADLFNFTLVPQTAYSGRYYPGLYGTVLSGLDNHPISYLTEDPSTYTDFSIDLQESSNQGAFNKASYISTIRIAEVAKKSASFVVNNFPRYTSFNQLTYAELIDTLSNINNKLNEVRAAINNVDEYRYVPVFWEKPQSMLKQYEKIRLGDKNPNALRVGQLEELTVYLSKLRQADYLVVRGKNINIGWGGFNKLYRDNPVDIFPSPLQFEFASSQTLTGGVLETVIIGFSALSGLAYGERYYLTGDVQYAAETMGVP
jgi:hypothetical protein